MYAKLAHKKSGILVTTLSNLMIRNSMHSGVSFRASRRSNSSGVSTG